MTNNKVPDHIPYSLNEGILQIEGFPDAVRAISLKTKKSKQLEHYAAHLIDLHFSKDCLNRVREQTDPVSQEALWRTAIIFFHKCFTGGSARSTMLKERKVYKGDESALLSFDYFSNLRNKHLIHDENAFSMVVASAVINGGGKTYKVERILTTAGRVLTLEEGSLRKLHNLIDRALDWANNAHVSLCEEITKELEQLDLTELLNMPQAQIRVPGVDDVGKRRLD